MNKVLLIEDDKNIRETVYEILQQSGYDVTTAENGLIGINEAKKVIPDLVICDIMMPGMDGIQTCEAIREDKNNNDIIIAFLTARSEDYSQIAGLQAGSDDYIAKPIKPAVLLSRIQALLRRKNPNFNVPSDTSVARLTVDKEKHVVNLDGNILQLPRKEFELLALLISKPNNVFQREQILSTVWGTDVVVGDRTIDVHIRKIREKIGDGWIKTIKGVGYKLTPQ